MKSYVEEKRIRPDILTNVILGAVLIIMLYKIIGNRIYGDLGSGFLAAPFSFFYFVYAGLVLAVQKSVWLMVRIRARRSQYLNAETNMKRTFRIFAVTGLVIGIILAASSFALAKYLFGSARGYLQFMIVAVISFLLGFQGTIRGYLQGLGYTRPIVIADLLFAFVSIVSGLITSLIMYDYGLKVNDLIHVTEFSSIYGAYGSMIGLLVGALVSLIQILISFSIRKTEIAEVVKNGAPRYLDNKNDVFSGFKSIVYLYIMPALICLLNEISYILIQNKVGDDEQLLLHYGILPGKVLPFVVALAIICCMPFVKNWNGVMAKIERDEIEASRDRLKRLIRYSSVMFIPYTIFTLALSETILTAIFGKSSDMAKSLLTLSSPLIFMICIALFGSWLISHMGKSMLLVINLSIGFGVYIAGILIFLLAFKLGLYGVVIADMLAIAVYDVISFAMIFKMLKYRQEVFATFLMPFGCSAAAGLVVFLINRFLVNLIGDALTLLICCILFFVIYMILLILLRRLKTYELRYVPLGNVFRGVSSRLQRDDFED